VIPVRGVAAVVVVTATAAAQTPPPIEPGRSAHVGTGDVSHYQGLYGEPMYWSLTLLVGDDVSEPPPRNRAILTRGVLVAYPRPKANPDVQLCDETNRHCLALNRPVPEIGAEFFADATFRNGHEAQVVGAFTGEGFVFWSLDSGPARQRSAALGRDRRLEELVTRPDRYLGGNATVRGRFRGANLFGDFASDAGAGKDAWVLRDGPFSIWVTGREARGEGWSLDVRSAADCVWEVEVEGKVAQRGEAVAIAARKVRLIARRPDEGCASKAVR
jgi:hypothetical protein